MMKPLRIFLFLSLLGILILFFFENFEEATLKGEVVSVEYSENFIRISAGNFEGDVLVFYEDVLSLAEGDLVEIFGREEIYLGEKQIVADRIYLIT